MKLVSVLAAMFFAYGASFAFENDGNDNRYNGRRDHVTDNYGQRSDSFSQSYPQNAYRRDHQPFSYYYYTEKWYQPSEFNDWYGIDEQADSNEEYYSQGQLRRYRHERFRLRGQILDFRYFRMLQAGEHIFATVQSQAGRIAKVDLGPASRITQLNLDIGDQVVVFGVRGRVNDYEMLLAERVHSRHGVVSVRRRPRRTGLRILQGEIVETDIGVAFWTGQEHLFAAIESEQDGDRIVDLGPAELLRQEDFPEGAKLSVLAWPERFKGQIIARAEWIHIDGR